MATTVYLCEKPDQARKIAAQLGIAARHGTHIDCAGSTTVTWCIGHLMELKPPEAYDPSLKAWSWSTLPIVPRPFAHAPKERTRKQFEAVVQILRRASKVVIATDPDREGELIAYEVMTAAGYRGEVERLWLLDLTENEIRKAIARPRPGHETRPAYLAALAPSCSDWLVGMNLTRAATLRLRDPDARGGRPISIGRVQTPTLALIVRRERQIRGFRPEDYFELEAEVVTEAGHRLTMIHRPPAERRIKDRETAARLCAQAQGGQGPIRRTQERKSVPPPLLPDLKALQAECNKRFGWAAQKTQDVAQALYDAGLASYPRTDCRVLAEDWKGRAPAILGHLLAQAPLAPLAAELTAPVMSRRAYDDTKVGAHTAIVPTPAAADPAALDADARRLYLLIARFYLAAHMADHVFEATALALDARGVPFVARGSVPLIWGWKAAFRDADERRRTDRGDAAGDAAGETAGGGEGGDEERHDGDDPGGILPPVRDGERGTAEAVRVVAKKTTPPPRFTEASLLEAMARIATFVDDEKAKARLKESSGIGTSATRAPIIETLKARLYVDVVKRQIVPTEAGMALIAAIERLVPLYADPVMTALWEDQLEEIAQGRAGPGPFVAEIARQVEQDVVALHAAAGTAPIPAHLFGAVDGSVAAPRRKAERGDARRRGARDATRREPPAGAARGPGRGRTGARPNPAAAAPAGSPPGTPLEVPFDRREEARRLGARWSAPTRRWIAPPGADLARFRAAGFLR